LCLFFTSNSAVFVGGGAKNIFASGRLVPYYASDEIIGIEYNIALCISLNKIKMSYVAILLEHKLAISNNFCHLSNIFTQSGLQASAVFK